ncbi:unnamed protein product [Cylindrotheca closterium]|uniref:Uncharacterized protein n=1 Tax=Cylindrotheca closterium TaxID=2856 RepID=A0AAD2G5V4_9STRA|nr:unnamed protein product [Cylindrotheca closterium]
MDKSPALKAASANTKKQGVAKSKVSSVGKKAMKKQLEIDLEQPKHRDPVSSNDVDVKQLAKDQDALQSANEMVAQRIAEREARLGDHYDKLLAKYLISLFNLSTIEDKVAEDVWSLRVLAIQISLQNPFSFFGIEEFKEQPHDNQFFDGAKSDPRLHLENPLVGFWSICSELFDYPWATITTMTHLCLSSVVSNKNVQHLLNPSFDHPVPTNTPNSALADNDVSDGDGVSTDGDAEADPMTVDGREILDDDEDNEVQVTGVCHNPRPSLSSNDDEDDDDDNEDVTSVQMKDAGEGEEREGPTDVAAREDQVIPQNRFTPVASQNPLPTTNSRLHRPLTVVEKISRLTQVNLETSLGNATFSK